VSLGAIALVLVSTACEEVTREQTVARSGPVSVPPPTTPSAAKKSTTTTATTAPTTTVTTAPPSNPGTQPALPAPTYLSSNIGDYIKLGGDRVVVVPDGVYRGGVVTAPHAATNGAFGGWLVLVAQHRGQAVVDMTNDYDAYNNNERVLRLQPGTSRIMFVGFAFRNGVVRNYGDNIRFWYTDHQNADYSYLEAGRPTPRMFQNYWGADDVGVYGSDFHNGTATAVFFGAGPSDITMDGVRIYDIDPRFGDPVDPMSHIVPLGSPPGDHRNFAMRYSYLEGYYTLFSTQYGSNDGLVFENIWRGFGYPSPFLLQVTPGNVIKGARRTNWQIFGPQAGYSQNGDDPYIYIDDAHYSGAAALQHRDRIDLVDTNVKYGYPAGVSDPRSAQNAAANPANVWRAAHPYDSWRTFFGMP
jgi:hypothetical protein